MESIVLIADEKLTAIKPILPTYHLHKHIIVAITCTSTFAITWWWLLQSNITIVCYSFILQHCCYRITIVVHLKTITLDPTFYYSKTTSLYRTSKPCSRRPSAFWSASDTVFMYSKDNLEIASSYVRGRHVKFVCEHACTHARTHACMQHGSGMQVCWCTLRKCICKSVSPGSSCERVSRSSSSCSSSR